MNPQVLKERVLKELQSLLHSPQGEQDKEEKDHARYIFNLINRGRNSKDSNFIAWKVFFCTLTELFSEVDRADPVFFHLHEILDKADVRDMLAYRNQEVNFEDLFSAETLN